MDVNVELRTKVKPQLCTNLLYFCIISEKGKNDAGRHLKLVLCSRDIVFSLSESQVPSLFSFLPSRMKA
jgi:hypothetical protein